MKLTPRELDSYRVGRLLQRMIDRKSTAGFEHEVGESLARETGKPFDPLAPVVPWQVFGRALTVAGTSGVTVGTGVLDVADILRPVSVPIRAGAQLLSDLKGNMIAPRIGASATGYWLANEATEITQTEPTFAAKVMAPKTAAALVTMTRQLDLQSAQVESVVRRHLLRLVAATMDAGALAGSGADGQPQGLLNVSGIQTQSGTTLGWDGVVNMREQCVTNGANDDSVAFTAAPTVAELLQTREAVADTGRFVWDGDQVAGRRGYATTSMPSQAMVAGDFSNILIGLFGAGPVVEVDPYSAFQSGVIAIRICLDMDVAIQAPAAFCKSTSIT